MKKKKNWRENILAFFGGKRARSHNTWTQARKAISARGIWVAAKKTV